MYLYKYNTSCFFRAACEMKTKLHCLQIGKDEVFDNSFCSEDKVFPAFSEFPESMSSPEFESLFWSPEEVTSLTPMDASDVFSSFSIVL